MTSQTGWHLGELDGAPLHLPPKAFLRHAVVFGASGSGKTVACKVLCEEALKSGLPVIAVDPQGDIASMQVQPPEGAEVIVWTPGSDAGRALRLNPFGRKPPSDPAEQVSWTGRQAVHIGGLVGVKTDEELSVLEAALADSIERAMLPQSLDDLAELLESPTSKLEQHLAQIARPRAPGKVARTLRRHSFGARGQLLSRGEPLDVDVLLGRKCGSGARSRLSVIYLNVLHDQESKASFLGFLLEEIYSWMLQNPAQQGGLQALLFLDELAPFVPPSNRKKPACKDAFLLLIRQARKYGLGMLLATQNIGDVDYQALNQCSTWLLGSCRASQELSKAKEALGARVSGADHIASALPSLPKGQFFLLSDEVFGDPHHRRVSVRHYTRAHRPLDVDGLRDLQAGGGPAVAEEIGIQASPSSSGVPEVQASDERVQPVTPSASPAKSANESRNHAPPETIPPGNAADPPRIVVKPARSAPSSALPTAKAIPAPVPAQTSGSSPDSRQPRREPAAPAVSKTNITSSKPRPGGARPAPTPSERSMHPGQSGNSELLGVEVAYRQPTIPVSPHGISVDVQIDLAPSPGAGSRPPADLVLVLDRSGSMAIQRKLALAKDAVMTSARSLTEEDRLGLVTFSSSAALAYSLGQVNETSLQRALNAVNAGGGTKISSALELAAEQLGASDLGSVFLLTDGRTQNDEERCNELAGQLRQHGISVFGFGVGQDWNGAFLEDLTQGHYEYLERAEDTPRYFEAAVRRLSGLFSREIRVSADTVGSVNLARVMVERSPSGVESERTVESPDASQTVRIHDVSTNEGTMVLVCHFEVAAPAPGKLTLGTLRFEGETLDGTPFRVERRLTVTVSEDRAQYERVEPRVVETLQRIHTKRVLLNAHEDIQSGSPERVARGTRRLRGATRRLDSMGQHDLATITRRIVEELDSNEAATDTPDMKALRQRTKRI